MSRPSRLLATALVALALTLAAAGCSTGGIRDSSPGQAVEQRALGWASVKPIAVSLPTGDPITPGAAVPGDDVPLLVNIWASWCVPCKKELPLLQRIDAAGTLRVIGFSRDGRKENATEALAKAGVTYPNWLDTAADLVDELDGRVPYGSVPATLLIRGGQVVAVHLGEFKTEEDVMKALEL